MAKNIKEVDEISTTDKLKAFKTLKEAGFRVEMNGSGVPTVVCANLDEMDKQLKSMKKVLKEMRYNGSFGIRGPRKTDNILAEEAIDSVAEDSEDKNDSLETLTA
ncbi:MAG: hypothetical protein II842_03205 [Butyrivibrio sp.]|nr:hypothetical protein [Butyrivibrio sp.]